MSLVTFDDDAAFEWVVEQVECQRRTSCETRPQARAAAAQAIGIAPGTVENIDRGRLKGLRSWVRDRIQDHKIKSLEAEFVRIERELAITRRCGSRASAEQIRKACAARDAIQAFLDEERR